MLLVAIAYMHGHRTFRIKRSRHPIRTRQCLFTFSLLVNCPYITRALAQWHLDITAHREVPNSQQVRVRVLVRISSARTKANAMFEAPKVQFKTYCGENFEFKEIGQQESGQIRTSSS